MTLCTSHTPRQAYQMASTAWRSPQVSINGFRRRRLHGALHLTHLLIRGPPSQPSDLFSLLHTVSYGTSFVLCNDTHFCFRERRWRVRCFFLANWRGSYKKD